MGHVGNTQQSTQCESASQVLEGRQALLALKKASRVPFVLTYGFSENRFTIQTPSSPYPVSASQCNIPSPSYFVRKTPPSE